MGSPLGPLFANFYMSNLENKVLPEWNDKPKVYCRYVDDIFLAVDSESQILSLKTKFENNSVLKFTYEIEKDSKLNFLDVQMTRTTTGLNTSVYIKETNNGSCLNFNSVCPDKYKKGVVTNFLHRAFLICNSWPLFHQEVSRIQ